jgi:WD40 repeat protein
MEKKHFLFQYMGHSSAINCFDFNCDINLIVTGSADYTVKYWSLDHNQNEHRNQSLKTHASIVWPLCILIEKSDNKSFYFIICLCANGNVHVDTATVISDFIDTNENTNAAAVNSFNFNNKLKFRNHLITLNCLEDYQSSNLSLNYNNGEEISIINDDSQTLFNNKSSICLINNKLIIYLITDRNSLKKNKIFVKKWSINYDDDDNDDDEDSDSSGSNDHQILQRDENKVRFLDEFVNNKVFDHLNKLYLNQNENSTKQLFEIINFGFKYCVFVDDLNNFYISNIQKKSFKKIEKSGLQFNTTFGKVYQLLATNGQQNFLFPQRSWLDGYQIVDISNRNNQSDSSFSSSSNIVFLFFTQRQNETFVITWNIDT